MSFNRSNVAPTTSDQQQTIQNLREELVSQFKSILTDSQKGLEKV